MSLATLRRINEIIAYLENEFKVTEQLLLLDRYDPKIKDSKTSKNDSGKTKTANTFHASHPIVSICHLCGNDTYGLAVTLKYLINAPQLL